MNRKPQKLAIEMWEHAGKLGLSPTALCMRAEADQAKCLLDVIDSLISAGPPASRTVSLFPCSQKRCITTIRLSFLPETEQLRQMSLARVEGAAILKFTRYGAEEIRGVVAQWSEGAEDFSVHPVGSRKARDIKRHNHMGPEDLASSELWFWRQMSP